VRSRLAVGSRPRPSAEPTSNKRKKRAAAAAADNLYYIRESIPVFILFKILSIA